MLKNTQTTYGSVSKWLHWIIFVLVVFMMLCGFFMDDFPKDIKPTIHMLHKSTGLLILILMLARLIWRRMNNVPLLPETMSHFEKMAARVVHGLLYVILIALPINGWIMATAAGKPPIFYNWILLPFPGILPNPVFAHQLHELHEILAYIILGLLALHIAASLKHHFIDKDNILLRMMPKNNCCMKK